LINKGKLGKRTGISGKSSAFVHPFVRRKRAEDEIAIGFSVLWCSRRYSGGFRHENGTFMFS